MRSGGSVEKRLPETDHGTGPATSASPAASASAPDKACSARALPHHFRTSSQQLGADARQSAQDPPTNPAEGDGDELEIERAYRLRLQSARRLPAHERQAALRAARHWVLAERKRLREQRASRRRGQRLQGSPSLPARMPWCQ